MSEAKSGARVEATSNRLLLLGYAVQGRSAQLQSLMLLLSLRSSRPSLLT